MDKRGQSGNVILLLMAGLFLLSLVGGGIFLLSPSESDRGNRAAEEARVAYDEAVAALDRALKDSRNVQDSLERNHSSFACLFESTGECAGKGGGFLLYDASQSKRPLSHLERSAGVDSFGAPCRGFPSSACPLRVETDWEPVCAGARCENTKSIRVKAKVTLAPMVEKASPLVWTKEALFTPQIALSAAARCERGGGVWAQTECLTPSQVAERQSGERRLAGNQPPQIKSPGGGEEPDPREARAPDPVERPIYECPAQIVVQGQYYPVLWLSQDRGQVTVPAMSCQVGNQQDVFVFQCTAKQGADRLPASNEGQWIQVEAVMAPPCDSTGRPLGEGNRF